MVRHEPHAPASPCAGEHRLQEARKPEEVGHLFSPGGRKVQEK